MNQSDKRDARDPIVQRRSRVGTYPGHHDRRRRSSPGAIPDGWGWQFWACAAWAGYRLPWPAPARPNVLLIAVDDLRAELGQYGSTIVRTPNMDALARSGVRFERAYSQYPLCNPARASFLTGRYPDATGVVGNSESFRSIHPDLVTLPQHFRRNGYVTLDVGKIFHFDDPASWTRSHHAIGATSKVAGDPGKDAWYAVEGAAAGTLGDNKVTEKALALLATPRSAPFFLAVGYRQPHTRWVCPKSYFDLYPPASMALPAGFASRPTAPPGVPAAAVRPRNADLFRDVEVTPSMARTAIAAYFACISYIDDQVGLLMAALERLQLRDRTVVVLMSDHGYHLGERGRWSKHGSLYELVGRVPLIIDAPGTGGRGRSSPRVVELVDLFPTLVQLAGLPPVAGLQGASFVPLLQNPNSARQRPAYAQVGAGEGGAPGRSVRTERWRYTEWDLGRAGVELYDHRTDPDELTNLAQMPSHAATIAELKGLLRNGPFKRQPRANWKRRRGSRACSPGEARVQGCLTPHCG